MSVPILRLHHVGFVVADLAESVAWYRKYLGFEHQYDFSLPGAQVSMLVRGDARLELFQVEGSVSTPPERLDIATMLKFKGINHLALHVTDLQTAIDGLAAAGVEIAIPPSDVPNDSGDRFAFIRDNEGMLVELFQPAT